MLYSVKESSMPYIAQYTNACRQSSEYPEGQMFSPMLSEFPLQMLLSKFSDSNHDVLFFDGQMFSVQYTPYENPSTHAPDNLIYIYLPELLDYYQIPRERITSFKQFYNPSGKNSVNLNVYPITDSTNKWLTICYLVPFLFHTSTRFAEFYSSALFNIIVKSSPAAKCNMDMNELMSIPETIIDNHQVEYSVRKTPVARPSNDSNSDVHRFLLLQSEHAIVPQLINPSDPDAKKMLKNHLDQYGIDAGHIATAPWDRVVKFYESLPPKMFNPADMMIVGQLLKRAPATHISSITNAYAEIPVDLMSEYQGIKTKTTKATKTSESLSYTSQSYIDITLTPTDEQATLPALIEYAQSKNLQMFANIPHTTPKAKFVGDKKMFDKLVELSRDSAFKTWIGEKKTKRATKSESGTRATKSEVKPSIKPPTKSESDTRATKSESGTRATKLNISTSSQQSLRVGHEQQSQHITQPEDTYADEETVNYIDDEEFAMIDE